MLDSSSQSGGNVMIMQIYNYLAIDYLESRGLMAPSEQQINKAEKLIQNAFSSFYQSIDGCLELDNNRRLS